MYYMYLSEERHSSGENGTRPYGLPVQMAPDCVARLLFGLAEPHSSRLARHHLG